MHSGDFSGGQTRALQSLANQVRMEKAIGDAMQCPLDSLSRYLCAS